MIEGQEGVSWEQWLALARACEESGVESLFRSDHYLSVVDRRERGALDAWGTICGLAAVTERVRLGTLVSPVTFRRAGELAKVVATADHVSGGRVELGLGAGWNEVEATAYGIDLHATPTERFDAFDEGCEAIIALLTNEQTTFTGRYVQLTDAYCNPKPIQRPHPPICIGGQGERRTLRSVARFAQHWNFPGGSAEQFAAKLDVLRAHCAELGRDPAEITVSAHLIGLRFGSGLDALVDEAKRYADAGLDLGIVYLPTPYTTALLDELAVALSGI